MSKKEFEKYLSNIYPYFFTFSYALLPDDLQAGQLVIDSYSLIYDQHKNLLAKLFFDYDLNQDLLLKKFQEEFEILFYQYIFQIGTKRLEQLKGGLVNDSGPFQFDGFFSLDIKTRGVLFLKEKREFECEVIAKIFKMPVEEVILLLGMGRKLLLEKSNKDNNEKLKYIQPYG